VNPLPRPMSRRRDRDRPGRHLSTSAYPRGRPVDADLRDTASILAQAARTLDFGQPVAIMLIAILHAIEDAEDPYRIVAELLAAATERLNQMSHQHFTLRDNAAVAGFFDGLEILAPGVVRVEDWRPDSEAAARDRSAMWGGVGRKA
jgi:S-adenosyl methyltransferase